MGHVLDGLDCVCVYLCRYRDACDCVRVCGWFLILIFVLFWVFFLVFVLVFM